VDVRQEPISGGIVNRPFTHFALGRSQPPTIFHSTAIAHNMDQGDGARRNCPVRADGSCTAIAGGTKLSTVGWSTHHPSRGGWEVPASRVSTSRQSSPTDHIYLVCPGRTVLHSAGVLRGRLDPGLDSFGQFQAMLLGAVIGSLPPRLVVASPLGRAVATAQAVAGRAGLSVEVDKRLVDRDYGPWAGRPLGELLDRWGSLDEAPDVEATATVVDRATRVLEDISGRTTGGPMVVVAHEAVNRLVLADLDPSQGAAEDLQQETGCFNILERRGGAWSVLRIGTIPGGHFTPGELLQPQRGSPASLNPGAAWRMHGE
jgi:broad specificity phosphatase PhoE